MRSEKFINKIKLGITLMVLMLSGAAPAFAAEIYPGYEYVPLGNYGMTSFIISKIDPTNDELEFSLEKATVNEENIESLEVGWVPSVFPEALASIGSERLVSKNPIVLSEYLTEENSEQKKYTISTDSALANIPYHKLFYIVGLKNGTKWANLVDYGGDCGDYWFSGKSCNLLSVAPGVEYNSVSYMMANVEVKEKPVNNMSTTDNDTKNTSASMVDTNNDTPTSSSVAANANTSETAKTDIPVEKTEVAAELATVKTVKNISVIDDTDEEEEEVIGENEEDLSPEGPGETTLEVPNLGKTECSSFDWIPYFLGGAALGTVSTWFLVYILNKRKLSFLK